MKRSKLAAFAASLAVAASLSSIVPMSAGAAYSVNTGSSEVSTSIDKYLVMKKEANVPNVTFNFTVEAGAAVNASAGKLAVLAGVDADKITGKTVSFSTADTATNEENTPEGDTPSFTTSGNTADAPETKDEKYVKKSVQFDFSAVGFTEPGVYRYIITEENEAAQGITYGYEDDTTSNCVRTLDVYVENDTSDPSVDDKLKIAGYVIYNGTVTSAPLINATEEDITAVPNGAEVEGAAKRPYITNTYSTQDLTFGKVVKGNQASRDKYFKYTVVISGISAENTVLSVDLANADTAVPAAASLNKATNTAYAGKTNPDALTADTSAENYTVVKESDDTYTITVEYYLCHGQYITIKGLPEDASYSITEAAEDYASTRTIPQADSVINWDGKAGYDALADAVSGTISDADIHTGYVNERKGTIPTGVIMTVAGSAALVLIGFAGAVAGTIYMKKKKSEED